MAKTILSQVPGADFIEVRITPTIERQYKARGVFPELRLENAHRITSGATGHYLVSPERARELLADAEALDYSQLPRGLPAAYTALQSNLRESVREWERRGLWDDPGFDEGVRRVNAASAILEVGEKVLYFAPGAERGEEVVIVRAYGWAIVKSDKGPYVDASGSRHRFQQGYAVMDKGRESFFVPAHRLTRDDCKPAHLKLVYSRPTAPPVLLGELGFRF